MTIVSVQTIGIYTFEAFFLLKKQNFASFPLGLFIEMELCANNHKKTPAKVRLLA
jgi:hypothetical protein